MRFSSHPSHQSLCFDSKVVVVVVVIGLMETRLKPSQLWGVRIYIKGIFNSFIVRQSYSLMLRQSCYGKRAKSFCSLETQLWEADVLLSTKTNSEMPAARLANRVVLYNCLVLGEGRVATNFVFENYWRVEDIVNSHELSLIYIVSSSVHKQLKSLLLRFDSNFQGCSFSMPYELVIFSPLRISWIAIKFRLWAEFSCVAVPAGNLTCVSRQELPISCYPGKRRHSMYFHAFRRSAWK